MIPQAARITEYQTLYVNIYIYITVSVYPTGKNVHRVAAGAYHTLSITGCEHLVSPCSGHGKCDTIGKCVCDAGYRGMCAYVFARQHLAEMLMYSYLFICICTYIYVCVYVYVGMHVCIHIYVCTYM